MPRSPFTKRAYLFVGLIATAIIFALSKPSFSSFFNKTSIKIVSFPTDLTKDVGQYFQIKKNLLKENASLRKKVADLSLTVVQLKNIKNENERLRELLEFKKRFGFDTISAEIVARNPSNWIGSFTINKGSNDGIKKSAAICAADGLIGKVFETEATTSSIMLVSNPGFKAGGIIKRNRVNAVIAGAGDGLAKMLYIPLDAEIVKGDIVETSGFSHVFPKGITIGKVIYFGKDKTGLYKYAVVKPAVDPFVQEEVLCLK